MSELMKGKRGLVMGVANDHSIAWGIARTLAAHGAELAFTYQGDALAKRVDGEPRSDAKLRVAFQWCLGREPNPREAQRLRSALAEFGDDREAWFSLCRVLLNLDEFITRE